MKIKLHHIYVLSTSIAMLMFYGLNRTSMPWWYSSLHCLMWIMIGIVDLSRKKRLKTHIEQNEKTLFFIFGIPCLLFWIFTILAWVKNSYIEPNTISRSISWTLQFVLILLYVVVVSQLFKDKLVKYTFHAAILDNILVIIFAIARWGVLDFIRVGLFPMSEYSSSWTLDNLNITAFLEVHDVTFAFGFFLIYYVLFYKGIDKKKNILICALFIYLGLKRIQLLALFLVIGLSILITGKSKKGIKYWSTIITGAVLIILLGFIWLIDSNIIAELSAAYNINFMGRLRVYYNLSKYFSFGPRYFGHGMSFSRIIAEKLVEQNILHFTGHSDILMNYIDYGFWEFIVWIVFVFGVCTRKLLHKYGVSTARLWLMFTIYAFITYLTDNTTIYFCFQSVYMTLMYGMFVATQKNKKE